MATITRRIDSVSVTLPDAGVLAALLQDVNVFPQDNTVRINGVDYFLNTLSFGSGGGGTFANATWDVLYNDGRTGMLNRWPAGASIQDISVQNGQATLQCHLGRNSYLSAVTTTITDSNALFNNTFVPGGTIAADSSMALAKLTVKSVVLPGTYRLIISCTDGVTPKTRTFDIVVTAYPSVAPGDGWL